MTSSDESTEKSKRYMDSSVPYALRGIIYATFLLLLVMILQEVGGAPAVASVEDLVMITAGATVAYAFYPYWSRALLLGGQWVDRWWSNRA